jgi:hypothetical protein
MINILVDEDDFKERFAWLCDHLGPPTESVIDKEIESWAWKLPVDWHFKLRRVILFKRGEDALAFKLKIGL